MAHNLPAQDTDENVPQRQSSGIGNVLLILFAFVIGAAIALMMVMDAPVRSGQATDNATRATLETGSRISVGISPN